MLREKEAAILDMQRKFDFQEERAKEVERELEFTRNMNEVAQQNLKDAHRST